MATKNKKLTYDIDELKSAFNVVLSDDSGIATQKEELKKVKAELANINAKIGNLDADIKSIQDVINKANAPKDLQNAIDEYSNTVAILTAMHENYAHILELTKKSKSFTLTTEEKLMLSALQDNHNEYVKEYGEMVDKLILEFNVTKTNELIEKINERIKTLNNVNFQRSNLGYFQQEKSEALRNQKHLVEKQKRLEAEISKHSANNFENFKAFLKSEGLPTVHAEEIFEYMNDHSKALQIDQDSFKIRKRHPVRDFVIKKGLIPASIVGAGIGSTIGYIASTGLVGGSTILGIIPVSGTPGLTALATTMVGGVIGLAVTPIVINTKGALVKSYYKARYKSAKRNLKDYENGTELENLHISNLMEKVENTKHSILKLSQGNWFTKMFKFLPKHYLNTINRNRIHHIEKYTKDLMAIYANIENSSLDADKKDAKLKSVYELLTQVDNFVAKDVAESKLHAMLTCKEKGKHTHKATIENIDIFANLKIYLDTVGLTTDKVQKAEQEKQAKKTTKNLKQKTATAAQILNEGRLIPQMIARNVVSYEEPKKEADTKPSQFQSVERKVISQANDGEKTILSLENGKKVELNSKDLIEGNIVSVKNERNKLILTYEDGIMLEVTKIKKVQKEVVAALELLYDLLKHNDYIEEIKKQGFSTSTINALKKKLQAWEANKTSGFSTSGKVKELYNYCLDSFGDLVDLDDCSI